MECDPKGQFESLKVFRKPQCLIQTDKDGVLEVVKDTVDELMMVDMAVNVVAIAGISRTGKSYLMNRLAGKKSGFALDNSIQAKTKGIWVWCKYHPTQKDQVLLLLDTEGLEDIDKGSINHDNKLLVLAMLLCSTLVYNTMTNFTQDALEKLMFTTEMSKNIQISKKDSSDENIDLFMPRFVLCIRDFTLSLENGEDEYLENCLKEKTNKSEEKFNETRRCIKKYFTKRKAFTFDRPAGREVLKELDKATDEDLSRDFIKETDKFSSYIYECPPKMLKNKKLVSCRMLTELLTAYVDAIKLGQVPCIDDALTVMCKAENTKLVNDAIEKFKVQLLQISIPVANKDILLSKSSMIQTKLLSDLKQKLLYDDDKTVWISAKEAMDHIYKKREDENSQQLYKKCYDQMANLYKLKVLGKVTSGRYLVAGGYDMYKRDMDDIVENYRKKLEIEHVDPMQIQRAKNDFKTEKTQELEKIIRADKNISKKEKEEEMKKMEREFETTQIKERERHNEELQKQKQRHDGDMDVYRKRKAQDDKDHENKRAHLQEELARSEQKIAQLQRMQSQSSSFNVSLNFSKPI